MEFQIVRPDPRWDRDSFDIDGYQYSAYHWAVVIRVGALHLILGRIAWK